MSESGPDALIKSPDARWAEAELATSRAVLVQQRRAEERPRAAQTELARELEAAAARRTR